MRQTAKGAIFAIFSAFNLVLLANATSSEGQLIRETFVAYKAAILQQRGETAVLLVNTRTIQYYAQMKGLALEAHEKDVRRLTPLNKIMVLTLRHRVPVAELKAMKPEELFTHAVNQGWIGKNSVLDSDIGIPQVFGSDASAEYIKSGKPTPLKYRFTKEDGKWKIDLTAITPMADQAMIMLIKKEGLDEDKFVIGLIESTSGKKVMSSIWAPLDK